MTLKDRFMRGKPLDGEMIIDCHMHVGIVNEFYSGGSCFEKVIEKMDATGVKMGFVSCLRRYDCPENGNREVIRYVEKYPGKLRGMIYFNPHYPHGYLEEFLYCRDSGCFCGIKIHPEIHQRAMTDDFYLDIFKLAGENRYPVLTHTWDMEDVAPFNELAERFPDTTFILGHSGGISRLAFIEAVRLAGIHENIFLDTALSYALYGTLQYMAETAGSGKILFGSDANWNLIEAALGRVIFADISDAEKKDILGLNAKRLFGCLDGIFAAS